MNELCLYLLLCGAAIGTRFQPGLVVSLKLERPQLGGPLLIQIIHNVQGLVCSFHNGCIALMQQVYQVEDHLQASLVRHCRAQPFHVWQVGPQCLRPGLRLSQMLHCCHTARVSGRRPPASKPSQALPCSNFLCLVGWTTMSNAWSAAFPIAALLSCSKSIRQKTTCKQA